jgi:DNA-binding GntR family transcriptional regulator
MKRPPPDTPPLKLPESGSGTLSTAVYERIRADILAGALHPGQKLRVEFVRERYKVGNSPVREALSRLSADGLVLRQEQRGFTVAPISVGDLQELIKTRSWIEAIALRESIARHTPEWEESVVLAFHRLSRIPRSISPDAYETNPEWERRHRAFHLALLSNCGSRWLLGFCESLADQAYRYRQLAGARSYPNRNEADEHQAIMQAAIDGDAGAAVAALEAHYARTARIILEAMQAGERPAGARRRVSARERAAARPLRAA